MGAVVAIERLIPHRPPMLLVDKVVRHEGLSVDCRTTIREDMPFVRGGAIPALVAIELFAQSAATLVSLLAQEGGAAVMSGALLGTRRIDLHTDALRVGDVLDIHCEEKMAIGTTAQIQCAMRRDGALLAEGSINVMAGTP